MQRLAIWKVLTIGAAFTGLGIAGAGAAAADTGLAAHPTATGISTDWPFDDVLDDLDEVVRLPSVIPGGFVGLGDDWDDDWDDWYDD
ncbi:hypothetical protein [Mycobacterium hubeiense]|uniref:hypothetical protein n=1 Tax=Mycobacterium hubeiense TaxID=1867256 RepID=UPI000C7F2F42|nr:hypothetical protein [Mycobacterium sp. QGD 101]